MYEMTKDGFMFLVMGFTGKAAAQIKEAYINAFNLMHAKLFPKTAYGLKELPTATPKTLTPAMLRHINKRVAWLVKNQVGTSYKALGGDILEKFNVNRRENIPLEKYREVCEFLNCEPDAKALEGELLEYQPPQGMVLVPESELESFRHYQNNKVKVQICSQQDKGLLKYIANLDNSKFAMIPLEKWEDLSQAGSFAHDEKVVQVKSGQVIKMDDFVEQVFQDPKHPYVMVKRDVMVAISALLNSVFK